MSNDSQHPSQRITPPFSEDAESLREYGRQLAMDSLIAEALADENVIELLGKGRSQSPRPWMRRAWLPAAAAVLLMATGIFFWKSRSTHPSPTVATLDARWELQASNGADYRIINANHIELRSGEVRFTSTLPAELLVETPIATSTAKGTDFFIGHHISEPAPPAQIVQTGQPNIDTNYFHSSPAPRKRVRTVTRLLVVSGKVTLSTDQGSATAGPKEAITAAAGETPEKLAMEANSSFAFDFYAQLVRERPEENLFFSPYSLSNALLMLAEGARGETAEEMGTVLGFPDALLRKGGESQIIPWEIGKLRSGQASLNRLLHTADDTPPGEPSLRIANAVWGDKSTPFNGEWQNIVTDSYGADSVQLANFAADAESERLRINDQTAQQTGDLIKDLLSQDSLRANTRLALVNAISLKGNWQTPFNPEFTAKKPFTLASGKEIKTDMMHLPDREVLYGAFQDDGKFFETPLVSQKGVRQYPDKNGFAIVELPYRGDRLSMVVITPNDPAGLPSIEALLTPSTLQTWLNSLSSRAISLHLPKFKSQTSYPSARQTLASLGMPSAFTVDADFSGLCPTQPLFIDNVIHRAAIEINEKGAAAAAETPTAKVLAETDAKSPKLFTPIFRADRPFLYLIRDRESGSIVFLGRMLDPSEQ